MNVTELMSEIIFIQSDRTSVAVRDIVVLKSQTNENFLRFFKSRIHMLHHLAER